MDNPIRRMNRHRNFPKGTCPASRHTAMIATELHRRGKYHMIDFDPDHVATSLAATVTALWQARAQLHRLGYQARICGNGIRWVKKQKEQSDG